MTAPLATPALRAVVVDDTPDLRELLCLALQTTGEFVVVGEAGNGVEGIARVRQHEPDIVMLDLAMPVMDGLEALPQIREICPDAAIIVLSGFGASAMAHKALAAGADGYLEKGAPVASILDYVRSIVGRTSPPPGLRVVAPTPERDTVRRAAGTDLDVAFDLAPDGVLVLAAEPGLTVLAANPRATEFLGVRDLAGKALADVDVDLAALVRRVSSSPDGVDETRLGSPPRTVRVTLRHAQDRLVVYLHPQEDPGGVEMLRRAIATTAHEIRTPVTVLVGVADTLRERGDDITADLRARLGAAVVRQARLLDTMTSDLLTAAQAHRGTLQLALERVDVKSVLGTVLDRYAGTTLEGTVHAKVLADPFRLEQMVTNLLGNALKYGAAPYAVRVSATDDEVLLQVVDHGDGVPADFVPLLFDEFTRANGTSARGTGLGLYVVASLAAAQNGSVSYERVGDESVFTIALPRAD